MLGQVFEIIEFSASVRDVVRRERFQTRSDGFSHVSGPRPTFNCVAQTLMPVFAAARLRRVSYDVFHLQRDGTIVAVSGHSGRLLFGQL